MKSRIFLSVLITLAGFSAGCYVTTGGGYSGAREVRETEINDREYNANDLNAYGEWVNTPEYGRVWRPYSNNDWQPFYDGRWVYDGHSWIWASNEAYGRIVYHYGNWVYTNYDGWVWIPSYNKWSPARVQWINNGDYIGWAPMPVNGVRLPEPWEANNRGWFVVRTEDFNRENLNARRIRNIDAPTSFNRAQYGRTAPDVKVIERKTNQPVQVIRYERGASRDNVVAPATKTRGTETGTTPAVRERTGGRNTVVQPAAKETEPRQRDVIKDNSGQTQPRERSSGVRLQNPNSQRDTATPDTKVHLRQRSNTRDKNVIKESTRKREAIDKETEKKPDVKIETRQRDTKTEKKETAPERER
jgi:hypothetical protein